MRQIEAGTFENGPHRATTFYSTVWDEYVVRLSHDGNEVHDATYFTSDRDDAIGTAEAMVMTEDAPEPEVAFGQTAKETEGKDWYEIGRKVIVDRDAIHSAYRQV